MPLVMNISRTAESTGPYTLEPGCWDYIPESILENWGLAGNPNFLLAPASEQGNDKADIVIVSGCPIGVTGGGQQPAQIAKSLAAMGHRVLFVQSSQSKTQYKNILIFHEPSLFRHSAIDSRSKERLTGALESFSGSNKKKIALFTFPSKYTSEIALITQSLGFKNAYWCLDDWEMINEAQRSTFYQVEYEKELIQRSDFQLSTSRSLVSRVKALSGLNSKLVPNGFNREAFTLQPAPPKPYDLVQGERTFVYWGELQGRWLDWNLIKSVATLKPNWVFNLIGPNEQIEDRLSLRNVIFLGEKPLEQLHAYGQASDIGIIPFIPDRLSDAVNPIKAYEYLACHLPIISETMPELNEFPHTYQVKSAEGFIKAVAMIDARPANSKDFDKFLKNKTWDSRATEFLKHCKAI